MECFLLFHCLNSSDSFLQRFKFKQYSKHHRRYIFPSSKFNISVRLISCCFFFISFDVDLFYHSREKWKDFFSPRLNDTERTTCLLRAEELSKPRKRRRDRWRHLRKIQADETLKLGKKFCEMRILCHSPSITLLK